MATAPVTDVRERLSEIIDEVVAQGTEWTITRHGRPVAVIVSVDEYESLIESLNILSDPETLTSIDEAEADMVEGRVRPLEDS